MGVAKLDRGAIGVAERGGGGRLPILFLHGVGSTKSVWEPQLAYFGANRRALAFDYPGYGESDQRAGESHDMFALAMVEALDALGIERAHICGLSLGGVVAIAVHQQAPGRCASLILADSFARHPEGREIYERSVTASRGLGMRALAQARAPSLLGSAASDALREGIVADMAGIDPSAYRQGAAAVWLADQRDRLSSIAVPTLVLVGDEDRITPPSLSQELAAGIAGARMEIIHQSGHLANLEQPDDFNRIVDEFLSECEGDF